jgi:hypothetical protein
MSTTAVSRAVEKSVGSILAFYDRQLLAGSGVGDGRILRWQAGHLRASAKRTVGVVRIGVDGREWLSVLKNRVMSVLRVNQCRLGMRIDVGTSANTQSTKENRSIVLRR